MPIHTRVSYEIKNFYCIVIVNSINIIITINNNNNHNDYYYY